MQDHENKCMRKTGSRAGRRLLAWAFGLWAVPTVGFFCAPGAVFGDTITLVGGRSYDDVEIVQARWDSVSYKQGRRPAISVAGSQVESFERSSVLRDRVKQLASGGDFDRANQIIEQIPNDPSQAWVAAEGLYLIAKARAEAGQYREASDAYKAYLDKFKDDKDWFVPHATLGLAQALLALNQPGTAEIHFKDLATFGGQWALEAELGQGDAILRSRGKAGALDARRFYDQVARNRAASVELRQKALVGRARAFLLQEQYDQVIQELEQTFFESPKPEELVYTHNRAAASLLMGRAYMGKGGPENLQTAEIWLLRVPALYAGHTDVLVDACDALVEVYNGLNNQERASEWSARKASATKSGDG
jgi:predicted negative regulator of RcsB-dependent stress response